MLILSGSLIKEDVFQGVKLTQGGSSTTVLPHLILCMSQFDIN